MAATTVAGPAAVLTSLIATCKRLGVDPFTYLRDVFERISRHPQTQLAELLPDHWKLAEQDVACNKREG